MSDDTLRFDSVAMATFSTKVKTAVQDIERSLSDIKNAGIGVASAGQGRWTASFNEEVSRIETMVKNMNAKYTDSASRADNAGRLVDQTKADLDRTFQS